MNCTGSVLGKREPTVLMNMFRTKCERDRLLETGKPFLPSPFLPESNMPPAIILFYKGIPLPKLFELLRQQQKLFYQGRIWLFKYFVNYRDFFKRKEAFLLGERYGYIRVSEKTQNLQRQWRVMTEQEGIPPKYIFEDKASGKDFNRKAYNALVGTENTVPLLREGDLLVIYSIDRLGRNYGEIREQWKHITQTLKADIKVIDMPLLDTRSTNGGDLERTFIADLVLQILSYCAQKERESILARQRQGIDAMKVVNGKRISSKTGRPTGRPEISFPENWDDIYTRWKSGQITGICARQLLNLKTNTFYKLIHKYESQNPSALR